MAKIFCIANQKGGVGKTTTALNLATGLVLQNRKVLFIDLDPQGNGTMGAGIDKLHLTTSVYDLLIGRANFHEVVKKAKAGFDVLPANRELAGAEIELVNVPNRDVRLRDAIMPVLEQYDYVLIDCPPSLSMITMNAFCLAQSVIVPMQCEYFALEGLTDLVTSIRRIHSTKNKSLRNIYLLRVMFDPRVTLQQQVSQQLEQHFGEKVFKTVIPRNVRLAEAPSYGEPGILYDRNSKGAKAYMNCVVELLTKVEG